MSSENIKFSIQIENQFGFDFTSLKDIATTIEKKKYDALFTCDHFFLDSNSAKQNTIEAYTMLAALSQVTKKLRLGTLVTCMGYREPSVLAKIIASLDHISEGRTIIGLGAGWKEQEYKSYGIRFPPLKERMDRLEEGIQLINKMLTDDYPIYTGKYYQIENAFNAPKPYNGVPPLLIGGTGEKRTLKLVAKYADMSNFAYWDIEKAEHLLEVLKNHCKNEQRNYDDITKTFYGYAYVTEDEDELQKYFQHYALERNKTVEEVKEQMMAFPGSFIGLPEQVIERYQYLIDLGFSYFQVIFPFGKEVDMSQKFADLVMKKI